MMLLRDAWTLEAVYLLINLFIIQGHHPFKLGFGFIMTCIMIVYVNVMKSGTN